MSLLQEMGGSWIRFWFQKWKIKQFGQIVTKVKWIEMQRGDAIWGKVKQFWQIGYRGDIGCRFVRNCSKLENYQIATQLKDLNCKVGQFKRKWKKLETFASNIWVQISVKFVAGKMHFSDCSATLFCRFTKAKIFWCHTYMTPRVIHV